MASLCSRCQLSEITQPCILGGREPCLVCQEDMELERKIQELEERRRILRMQINALHDPFVLSFPPEISSHIFLLSMEKRDDEPHNPSLRSRDRDTLLRWLPTPFLLGAVCRGWRQLARSTPQLWTTVSFTLEKPTNIPLLEAISDWLQLSGSLPLAIWIFNYKASYNQRTAPELCAPVIDILNQHSGRWGKVVLTLHPRYLRSFCGTSPPTNLYDLKVKNCTHIKGADGVFPTFKMNSNPSPTNVTIQRIHIPANDMGWDNLTTLMMEDSAVDEFIEILRRAPLLDTCVLSDLDPPTIFTLNTVFRHTSLKTLNIHGVPAEALINLIDGLECPSLEKLGFHLYSWNNDEVVNAWVSFFERSGSRLQTLDLRHLYSDWLNVENFKKLFDAMAYLRQIDLSWNMCDPDVVDGLLQHLSSSAPILEGELEGAPTFLPRLEYLNLALGSFYVDKTLTWKHIPAVYNSPQRKLLTLELCLAEIEIDDRDALTQISNLIDEGVNIRIFMDGEDYFQNVHTQLVDSST